MPILLLLVLAAASAQEEAKVRETIGLLEKALVSKDEALADHFDLPRLLKEMESRGAIPEDGGRFRGARRLEDNLATIASAPGALNGGWNRIEPLSVRVNPAGDEAEAFCRVTIGGKKGKFRFWLTRDGASWKTFDLEALDGSYRLSVIGLQYTPGVHDDEERQSLRDGVMALQRGSVALAKGQPEAARDALSMARRSAPAEYVMDWIDLVDGQALSAMGDPAGALKAADRVLVRRKDLAPAQRLKADCHAALGEPAKAVLAAREYLKLVGDDADVWALVGRASERLGRTEAAVEAWRKAAAADAEDYHSRWELGRILLDGRRAAEAATFFAAASRLAPVETDVFENAADLLDRSGAHVEALALADEAAKRRPEDATVLSRRGRALRTVGRLKEAEELLRGASKANPEDAGIAQELLLVLAQSGRDAEAQERMRIVVTGDLWFRAYARAFVHAAAGRTAPALEELKSVFRSEHTLETSVAWVDKEPVFEKLRGDREGGALLASARAARDYGRARGNPDLPPEELLRAARERKQAVPDHALAWFDEGRALRRLGRPAEAEASILKAVELSADKTNFQDELGRALAAQGKLDEALAVAEKMIRESKAEEFGMDLRVSAYAIAGKREAAVKALQALLAKHPEWHSAAAGGGELDEFRRLPAVQELLRKARAKVRR